MTPISFAAICEYTDHGTDHRYQATEGLQADRR